MDQQDRKPSNEPGKIVELFILWATAISSVAIAALDFLGAIEGFPWISERIPTLILLVVGLLASYIALERRGKLHELSEAINKLALGQEKSALSIMDSLQGVQVRKFETGYELLSYLNDTIANAKVQIDDISWRSTLRTQNYGSSAQSPNKQFPVVMREAVQRVPYREIMIFNKPGRKEKLQNLIVENMAGYSCVYFPEDTEIPLLQFVVIDHNEVIVLGDIVSSSISIRHPSVVKVFENYYEEAWHKAQKLKIGKTIYWDAIREVVGSEATEMLIDKLKHS